MADTFNTCTCGARFNAVQWAVLRLVGFQHMGDDGWLELRICEACNSTLSVQRPVTFFVAGAPTGGGPD